MSTNSKAAKLETDAEHALSTDEDREFSASIDRARAQVKAGEVVDGQRVAEWVASWGSESELPRPQPVPKT